MHLHHNFSDSKLEIDEALVAAFQMQSKLWPDVSTDYGSLEPGWRTAQDFFETDAAIESLLHHEASLNEETDAKASGAFLMTDYCHVFTAATVPLVARFGLVGDLSPDNIALQYYMEKHEHEGRIYDLPRAHVRYLSDKFVADGSGKANLSACADLIGFEALCDYYRKSTEHHFAMFINSLSEKTSLGRNALWRLLGDAIAARFLEAGRKMDCLETAKKMAMAILKVPGSPLNNRQLNYFDLSVFDRNSHEVSYSFRARGGCCRYYSVKGGKYCTTCVLNDPAERDAKLQAAMRRHLGVASENKV